MKLVVKKEQGSVPGGGYHYLLMPLHCETETDINLWKLMGFIILEVPDEIASRLITQGTAAFRHQVEIAVLTEKALKEAERAIQKAEPK